MRQIQQLVNVLTVVFRLKKDGQREQAPEVIEHGLKEALGAGVKDLLEMDHDQLLELCSNGGQINSELVFVLAELLEQQAELIEGQDFGQSRLASSKSLMLYKQLVASGESVPFDIYERIERLQSILSE